MRLEWRLGGSDIGSREVVVEGPARGSGDSDREEATMDMCQV